MKKRIINKLLITLEPLFIPLAYTLCFLNFWELWISVCALIGDSFGDDPNWYLNLSIYYHISNLLK